MSIGSTTISILNGPNKRSTTLSTASVMILTKYYEFLVPLKYLNKQQNVTDKHHSNIITNKYCIKKI